MNKHPFLRAYLAGICVPTIFLLVIMIGYTCARYVWNIPTPIERVIVFPMAFVPNLWGLWNVLHRAFLGRVSLGIFGALLPLLLVPLGYLMTRILDFSIPQHALSMVPILLPIGMILYYLVWKYLVSSLNAELGVA
jgi:hypothetical protein